MWYRIWAGIPHSEVGEVQIYAAWSNTELGMESRTTIRSLNIYDWGGLGGVHLQGKSGKGASGQSEIWDIQLHGCWNNIQGEVDIISRVLSTNTEIQLQIRKLNSETISQH